MLLPGPEAQQLATYLGWLLHRTASGFVAVVGVIRNLALFFAWHVLWPLGMPGGIEWPALAIAATP